MIIVTYGLWDTHHKYLQVHGLVLGQVVLGILTLYSFGSFPEWYYLLSILHLGWGTVLWLGALNVGLEMRSYAAEAPQAPQPAKPTQPTKRSR